MTTYRNKKHGYLVDEYKRKDGRVHFCPQGGGPSYSAPIDQFDADFEVAPPPVLRRGTVTAEFIDMMEPDKPPTVLPCWSDGRSWNGWGMPYFERATVDRLIELDVGPIRWDGDNVIIKDDDAEGGEYALEPRTMPDGSQAWDIGAGSWTWDSVEFGEDK